LQAPISSGRGNLSVQGLQAFAQRIASSQAPRNDGLTGQDAMPAFSVDGLNLMPFQSYNCLPHWVQMMSLFRPLASSRALTSL
jgi:hypothetical protein